MTDRVVVPIVEGHGEVESVRILLLRTWNEALLRTEPLEVLRPIRTPKSQLVRRDGLSRAIELAAKKLDARRVSPAFGLILVLCDADDDCPAHVSTELLGWAQQVRADRLAACVLANVEYETWFVAAAESLGAFVRLDGSVTERPEQRRLGKGWVKSRFIGPRYSETADQPRMTAKMDLTSCRARSPSYDKLCRELARLI